MSLDGGNDDILADILSEAAAEEEQASAGGGDDGGQVQSTTFSEGGGGSLRFETKKFVLESLLQKASSVVPKKDIMPVLKNFQLEATPGRLRVVATDLELSVVSVNEMVVVQEPGIAVFPAQKTLDIIREADEGDAVFEVNNGNAKITVGRTSWELKLQVGDDYPLMPEISDIEFHAVDRLKFLSAIASVRYAAAKDTTRPSLCMIDVTNGKMTACDGVRFQQADLGEDFPLSLQIPTGAIDDLVKLLRSASEMKDIGIGESDSHLVFRIATDVFLANKLMAQFPNMEQLLLRPALENKFELTADRQDLIDAVKRVRINADPETSAIALRLQNGAMRVMSNDKFGNAAEEVIDVNWKEGDRLLVVNHAFLLDMVAATDGKTCKFFVGKDTASRKSPILLRGDNEAQTLGVVQQMVHNLVGYSE